MKLVFMEIYNTQENKLQLPIMPQVVGGTSMQVTLINNRDV